MGVRPSVQYSDCYCRFYELRFLFRILRNRDFYLEKSWIGIRSEPQESSSQNNIFSPWKEEHGGVEENTVESSVGQVKKSKVSEVESIYIVRSKCRSSEGKVNGGVIISKLTSEHYWDPLPIAILFHPVRNFDRG